MSNGFSDADGNGMEKTIGVLGAGAWGTALAQVAAIAGNLSLIHI